MKATATRDVAASAAAAGPDAAAEACSEAVAALGGEVGLLLAFASGDLDYDASADALAAAAGGAPTAGLTGRGLISADGPIDEGCVAMAFGTRVRASVGAEPEASGDLRAAGRTSAQRALEGLDGDADLMLLFIDSSNGDLAEGVSGAYDTAGPGVPLAGGAAGGTEKRHFHDGRATQGSVVAVALASAGPLGVGNTQTCSTRGTPSIVTRSEGQRIEEIDGRPAEQVYLEQIGFTGVALDDEEFEALAITHPLAQPELHGDVRLRHVNGRTGDGAIISGTHIPASAAIEFTELEFDQLLTSGAQSVTDAGVAMGGDVISAALVFDCAGRRRALRDENGLAQEVEAISRALGEPPAPLAGLYTSGEVARLQGAKGDRNMRSSQSPSAEAAEMAKEAAPSPDDALRRRFVEAARRAEIVGLVNAATSEADLGLRFTEELCEVFDAEVAFLLDEGSESGHPRAVAAVGLPVEAAGLLLDRAEATSATTHMRPVALAGEDLLGIGLHGVILAPFRTEDGRGVLVGVGRLYDRPFDETDRSLVEAVTIAVGQGLERIWAYEARDRSAGQQAALVRAAGSMSRSLEITEVLQTLCDESRHALGCDTNVACLGDEIEGYVAVGAAGLPGFIGFRQPPGTGLGGHAVRTGRVVVTHAYQEEGHAPPEASGLQNLQSGLAVPLRWDDRARGFLSCGWNTRRRITTSEVELMEGFAELAGLACANAERHAAVREAAEVDGLTGCLNRDALQDHLSKLVARADHSGNPLSLALLDLDGFKSINDVFGHLSGDDVLRGVGSALRSSVRADDVVARYGGDEFALILPESSEERAGPVLDRVRAAIRSMDVPGGTLTACVGLAERAPGESLDDLVGRADEALREAKGSPGPGSIRRASRRSTAAPPPRERGSDSDRRQRWRAVGGDIGLAIARELDTTEASVAAVEELRAVLELEACAVLKLGPEGKLDQVASVGAEPSEEWLAADTGSVGRALNEKRAILGEQGAGRRDADLPDSERRGGDENLAFELAVPLIVGGRAWGAIACQAGGGNLDVLDVELVSAVAEHLSSAVRTGDLYEQLTQSMIGTAESLAAAMEAKDQYTADHARSIAELAVEVGRELGLPDSAIDDLRYGGIFHDLGKIAVPDSIINKPGPLTDEEFEVIKLHPARGAEILAPVPFLYGVRTIVRHAHEHFDGSGYPEGLKGEQIPLGARIVLAVDAYHAMTSDRPYRSAMSHEEACAELERESGAQFDPEVTEVLLTVLRRRGDGAGA